MKSHEKLGEERWSADLFMILAVSIGGLTQIVPLFFQDAVNEPVEGMKPYTALQLEGRDLYIREGCVGCHCRWCARSAPKPSATATTPSPAKASTTIRSCGAPSAPVGPGPCRRPLLR